MFAEESLWLSEALRSLPLQSGDVALDIGSSTDRYRRVEQPHIEENVARPLRERGIGICTLDVRSDPGVDFVCDLGVREPEPLEVVGRRFPLVLCNNVLVHLEDPALGAAAISSLVAPGGWIAASTPASYRRVRDPIDNGLRPSPSELAALLIDNAVPGCRLEVVGDASLRVDSPAYYRRSPRPSWFLRNGRWVAVPGFVEQARYRVPSRRWRVSCVLLRRSEQDG